MAKYAPVEYKQKSDCDRLLHNAEDSLQKFENCFETAFDERKTKANVVGSIFRFGVSLTKLALNTTGCAIKNAPKAVVAVAAIKRDIVHAIEDEIQENQKQLKVDALEQKIKKLKYKS